ncbi:MAG TPA: glycosyltransferase family 39 protein [Polyangiaceae bacterium]
MTRNVTELSSPRKDWGDRLRSIALVVLALGATVFYLGFVNQFYPIKEWLFVRYLVAWACTLAFVVSSLAAGWRLCRRLLPMKLPWGEQLVLSLTLGVLLFFLGVFVAGCFDLYRKAFFLIWPLLLFGYGGPQLVFEVAQLRGRAAPSIVWRTLLPHTVPQVLACGFLALGILTVYLQVLTPLNLGADCYWYHEPIAESYVAAGGMRRFNEGWYVGTYPQLASFLYTWAFLSPGKLVDHVLLCTHIEFALFLATLLGISVLAARLAKRKRLAYAAAAIFLFPKLFIYDSNLHGGADHILALFCTALFIFLLRFAHDFGTKEGVVAGLITAAALLTKYQTIYVFLPTALLVLALSVRHRKLGPTIAWGLTAFVFSSPHWLKNLVYYHDPLYPFLHRYFPSHPFHRGAEVLMKEVYWTRQFDVVGSLPEKLKATLVALTTFSFVPNDWGFHGMRPEFGSLFTLLIPALLFLKANRRLWLTVIGIHMAVALWYLINHQDRYLQCLVPAMAAVVAVALALVWKRGWAVRTSMGALVAVQVIWGADAPFIPAHTMIGDSPFRAFDSLMAMGYRGEYEQRYHFPSSSERFAAHLPLGTKMLLHLYDTHLGLGTEFATDSAGWQGAIEYLDTDSPAATAALLRGDIGVTHIGWAASRGAMSPSNLAREMVFQRMLREYLVDELPVSDWKMGRLNSAARSVPSAKAPTIIAWFACDMPEGPGLYTPRGLDERHPIESFPTGWEPSISTKLSTATAAIVRTSCSAWASTASNLEPQFQQVIRAGEYTLWARQTWDDYHRPDHP